MAGHIKGLILMKIPKTIIICGQPWTIKQVRGGGGDFDSETRTITVGIHPMKDDTLEIFLHEIIECIMSMRDVRYKNNHQGDNDSIRFVISHAEFQQVVHDIAASLRGYF